MTLAVLLFGLALQEAPPPAAAPPDAPQPVVPAVDPVEPPPAGPEPRFPIPLDPVDVTADEPRFVAPTRRDRIGRIWAPVMVNGQGPFRFVLDTGASHSALTPRVAEILGVATDTPERTVKLQGTTGSVDVPMVPVESLEFGDLLVHPRQLPVIPDALGGAEGVLGTDGLGNKRIHIDFRNDHISIQRSRAETADRDFIVIPVRFMRGKLLVADAVIGGVRVRAIIDTGGQATLGNEALKAALADRRKRMTYAQDVVIGATLDVETGDRGETPALTMGDVRITRARMTFGNFAIFRYWKLTEQPAILIGMDVLGLLDQIVIDYRRREVQIKLRRG